jgi:hypothetical protein
MLATCLPVSQRTGPVGCWIMAQESLGSMPETPLFWHMSTYPNRAAAQPAKGVKAELGCPENTEVRCPLFTDLRVP